MERSSFETICKFSSIYPEVTLVVRSGTHEELYHGLVSGELDMALNDQRRAFSDDYVNMELKNAECIIEISDRNPLSSEERLEVSGNRGFLPVEAVGKLPEVSGAIKRIPLFRKHRRVTRKYCIFWQEARMGYYIEEFAEMLRKRLS